MHIQFVSQWIRTILTVCMFCPWHSWPIYCLIFFCFLFFLNWNSHFKDSFWEVHLFNCGWLGILSRTLRCKWDWSHLLSQGEKMQEETKIHLFLLLCTCSYTSLLAFFFFIKYVPFLPPSHSLSLPLLWRLILNLPEKQMQQHRQQLITGCVGGCSA